jgi:DedD protein
MILASLAVIFLPMLFDGAGIERREVPLMPVADAPEPIEPIDPTTAEWRFVEEARRRRQDPTGGDVVGLPRHEPVARAELEDAIAAGPALDADGAPIAWSVQLASFADAANAERLRTELRDDGFEAYVTASEEGGRALHRVAVGPQLDADAVRRLRDQLAERYDLEGMVVRFTLAESGTDDDG